MDIIVSVNDTILKSPEIVYSAIIEPHQIKNYFVSKSTGILQPGEKIIWDFADYGVELEVDVIEVVKDQRIAFVWHGSGQPTEVEINLKADEGTSTAINITEKSFIMDETGVQKAMQQTQGWTDFICCLKAYLYTGINLRKGRKNDT